MIVVVSFPSPQWNPSAVSFATFSLFRINGPGEFLLLRLMDERLINGKHKRVLSNYSDYASQDV